MWGGGVGGWVILVLSVFRLALGVCEPWKVLGVWVRGGRGGVLCRFAVLLFYCSHPFEGRQYNF